MYNEDNECGGVFCKVTTNLMSFANETIRALVSVQYDEEFFEEIETRIINPIMEWKCKCGSPMLDAWMGCKHK